jgi:hypothetical protein
MSRRGNIHTREQRYLRIAYDRTERERELGAVGLRVRSLDDPEPSSIDCRQQEDDAFWTWAIVEVLRLTGLRLEELLELTHLSIREYRMPDGKSSCSCRSHRRRWTRSASCRSARSCRTCSPPS